MGSRALSRPWISVSRFRSEQASVAVRYMKFVPSHGMGGIDNHQIWAFPFRIAEVSVGRDCV